jgi:SNF2 family DNA or RNA helicase
VGEGVPAEITAAGDRILVRCDYRSKELVRMVPGRKWEDKDRVWTVPLSWGACQALRGVFGDRLEIGPQLAAWANQDYATRVAPALQLRQSMELPAAHPYLSYLARVEASLAEGGFRLFPHQKTGALFLLSANDALLSDGLGSGKTATCVTALRTLFESGADCLPVLVICPKAVMTHWEREINRLFPQLIVSVVTGAAGKRQKALQPGMHVYIMAWDNVRRHSRLAPYGSYRLKHCQECDPEEKGKRATCERCPKELNEIGFKTIIADEAHKQKDPAAKMTRALWAVQHGPTVTRRWSLTGTPIANHPGDIWAPMHGIAADDFGGRTQFVDRYGLLSWNEFGGLDIVGIRPDTKDEFFRVLDPRFRRMPKEVILPHLPPKLYQERLLEMSSDQKKAYRQMEEHLIAELAEGRLIATNPLAQLTRLMQFASATAYLNEDGSVKLVDPSCKVDELMVILEELGDDPLVVSSESRLLIELAAARLREAGITHSLIVGGQSVEERQRAIDDFQEGRVRVNMFTLKAGGVGLTLTRAGHLVRLQRSYSAIDNLQGEDRVHRIGSERHTHVAIIDLVAQDTVEETSQKMALFSKAERLEEVVRDRDALRRLLKG